MVCIIIYIKVYSYYYILAHFYYIFRKTVKAKKLRPIYPVI